MRTHYRIHYNHQIVRSRELKFLLRFLFICPVRQSQDMCPQGYSKGKTYGKHSAVLAAFRQFFIKTGEFDKKWSDDYEFIMDSRQTADYDLYDSLKKEDVVRAVTKAQEFVEEVKKWLRKNDLL